MFLLPVSRVPFRCYTRACRVSCDEAASTEVVCHRKPRDFESLAAFAHPSSFNFMMTSFFLIVSSQGDVRVSVWNLWNFHLPQATILRWNRQCRTPRPRWSANLALNYRQNSVREGLRHTVRTYCRLCVSVIEAKTASGSLTTHGLTLCHRLVKRLILLYHIISSIFRRIFSPDIQYIYIYIYMLLSRFSTCTLTV